MSDKERFICKHWSLQQGCLYNKDLALQFLKSVGAIPESGPTRSSVYPVFEWSEDDWNKYQELMNKLANEASLDLPTGYIECGEFNYGINQLCNQWTCEDKTSI